MNTPYANNFRIVSKSPNGEDARVEHSTFFNQPILIFDEPETLINPKRITTSKEFNQVRDDFLNMGVNQIDVNMFDQRVRSMGIGYFDYTENYTSPQRVCISRGFLTLLLDSFGESRENVNEAVSFLFSLDHNNFPDRQVRRYRGSCSKFLMEFVNEMMRIYQNEVQPVSHMLSHMLTQYFTDIYWLLKSKEAVLNTIFSRKLSKMLQRFIKSEPDFAVRHIVKRICGQYLARYCPQ